VANNIWARHHAKNWTMKKELKIKKEKQEELNRQYAGGKFNPFEGINMGITVDDFKDEESDEYGEEEEEESEEEQIQRKKKEIIYETNEDDDIRMDNEVIPGGEEEENEEYEVSKEEIQKIQIHVLYAKIPRNITRKAYKELELSISYLLKSRIDGTKSRLCELVELLNGGKTDYAKLSESWDDIDINSDDEEFDYFAGKIKEIMQRNPKLDIGAWSEVYEKFDIEDEVSPNSEKQEDSIMKEIQSQNEPCTSDESRENILEENIRNEITKDVEEEILKSEIIEKRNVVQELKETSQKEMNERKVKMEISLKKLILKEKV
jgi:hypothetical protein